MFDPKIKKQKRQIRHKRVRAVIKGTADRPRLYVFRSNKHIYAQLVDDERGFTVLSSNDLKEKIKKVDSEKSKLAGKKMIAYKVGEILAKKAIEKGIKSVVFDRNGYKYHGRIKALAEGARAAGLKF